MEEGRRRTLAEQTRGSNGHGHISRAKGLKLEAFSVRAFLYPLLIKERKGINFSTDFAAAPCPV